MPSCDFRNDSCCWRRKRRCCQQSSWFSLPMRADWMLLRNSWCSCNHAAMPSAGLSPFRDDALGAAPASSSRRRPRLADAGVASLVVSTLKSGSANAFPARSESSDARVGVGFASTPLAPKAATGGCSFCSFPSISARSFRRRFNASSTAPRSESICLRKRCRAQGAGMPRGAGGGVSSLDATLVSGKHSPASEQRS